jgi:putative ABC transport system permease protein
MVMIWENIKLACTSLMANKMRAMLTMLGIIIGIAAVIAIMTVGDSLVSYITEELNSMGANNIIVALQPKTDDDSIVSSLMASMSSIKESDLISTDMIDALYEQYKDDILAVTVTQYQGSGQVVSGKDYANVDVYGNSLGYFASTDVDMIAGNIFSERDLNEGRAVAIVSSIVVNNLFDGDADKALGSQIEVLVDDKYTDYTIIGVYNYVVQTTQAIMSNEYDISTEIYIPYKTSVSQTHDTSITNFAIVAKNGVDSDILANKIESFFDGYYRNNDDYQVVAYNMQTMVAMVSRMISTITLAISVIAAIALVVGGIGVMNIMLVSITERTREIGTRKALGATNASIRVQFIVEAMIICLIGGIIGVAFGMIGGQFAAKILGYPASPSIFGIIVSLIFSMATGLFFGYYPANKAAKMNPIDALRYE